MKQVLAMYEKIRRQLLDDKTFHGIVNVEVYRVEEFWSIKIIRVTFTATNEINAYNDVEWDHYTYHNEGDELDNEKKVAEFKKRFGLK